MCNNIVVFGLLYVALATAAADAASTQCEVYPVHSRLVQLKAARAAHVSFLTAVLECAGKQLFLEQRGSLPSKHAKQVVSELISQ